MRAKLQLVHIDIYEKKNGAATSKSWLLSSIEPTLRTVFLFGKLDRDVHRLLRTYYTTTYTRAAHTKLLLDVSLCWLLAHGTMTLFVTLSLVAVIMESFYRQLSPSMIARKNVCVKNGLLLAIWCFAPDPSFNPLDW